MLTNITDPLTAAGSILRIVTTGVELATTLQTYMELAREAEHELHDIVFDVNATAAALKQLHTIIDADRDLSDRTGVAVFKDDGVREVEMLALKCHAIYNNVALLLQRANHSESADADRGGRSSSRSGVPGAADEVALDPATLRPLTLMGKLRWPWLRPRILRCREQLNWLKVSLLFTLQIANIAQWQMRLGARPLLDGMCFLANCVFHVSGERHAETLCEVESRQQTARQLQKRRNSVLRSFAGIEAEGGAQTEPQRPATSSSGAESVLGAVFSTTKESTKERNTTVSDLDCHVHAGSNDPRQRSTTSCTSIGVEGNPADMNTRAFIARAFMSEQGLPEMGGAASVLPESSNSMLDALPITAAPTTFFVQKSAPAPGEAVVQSGNPSRHPPALKPMAANTRSSESSVIVDQLPSYYLNHWADRVFGRQSKYRNDKQSTTLEAYIAENFGRDVPIKVPFGHERLLFGLDKVLKDWRGDQWTKYLAASPLTRLALDAISEAARKASSHEKTCLAFKEYSTQGLPTPFMLAFFSLEKAKDPVILSFNGRRYSIPFAACQTLHGIEERILEVCRSSSASASLPTFIAEKRYEFADENDNIILPSFLIESIRPGIELCLLPRRMFIETMSEADTRQIDNMTQEPVLHRPASDGERRGWSDTLEHREQVETGESGGELFQACLSMNIPKREKTPIARRLRRALGRIPYETESYLWSLGWQVDLRWMYRPRRQQEDDVPPILPPNVINSADAPVVANVPTYVNPAVVESHEFPAYQPMDYIGYTPPPPPGPPPAPSPSPHIHTSIPTNGVDSEAQSLDDDLDLNVLDVGVEMTKGDMSIDQWLEQMTNVGCAGHETIATAELNG